MQEDDEWNLIEEMKGHQASIPSGTGTDNESHAYTVDADGITVENVWEDMSYPELRHVCSLVYSSASSTVYLLEYWSVASDTYIMITCLQNLKAVSMADARRKGNRHKNLSNPTIIRTRFVQSDS